MNLTEIPSDRPGYAMYQTVIEDTGIGMSGEFLPHLFEEFTRERSRRTPAVSRKKQRATTKVFSAESASCLQKITS